MQLKQQLKSLSLISLALGLSFNAVAANYSAVNKESCVRMKHTKQPFILVLNNGDNLVQSINKCAADAKLLAASVSALGQVHNPTLAYFTNNPTDKPTLTTFDGYYELASLNGNITNNSNQYYTHVHAALADKNFQGITGHVDSAEVGLTVEVTIVPFSAPMERTVDPETGFGPIVTK